MRLFVRFATVCLLLTAVISIAQAASPDLNVVLPRGGQRGSQIEVDLRGQRLENAQQILIAPATGISVAKLVNDEKEPGKLVHATLDIAPDAPIGPFQFRLRTASGLTDLHTFHVYSLPIATEKEPNTDFAEAQPIEFNHTVQGVIENEDIDHFAVNLTKGQRLSVEVQAIRLGGPLFDPALTVFDSRRFELASSDDTPLLKQDCFVSVIAPEDGRYIIAVRDASYRGGGNYRYRLHVGDFPRPSAVFPLGGQAGQEVAFQFIGDASGLFTQTVKLPDEPLRRFEVMPAQNDRTAPSGIDIRVSAFGNVMEAEPNDSFDKATVHDGPPPIAFNGILEKPGDVDCFRITLSKGAKPRLTVLGRTLGSPIDPVINVHKVDGKHLRGDDDSDGRLDPTLDNFEAPEDGQYIIKINDRLGNGGPDFVYRVEVDFPQRRLRLSIPEAERDDTQARQWVAVPQGNRWMSLIRADRGGVDGPLKLWAENLPAGVTMHVPVMAGNVNEVPVIFEAAGDAPLDGKFVDLLAGPVDGKDGIQGRYGQTITLVEGPPNRTAYFTTRTDRLATAVCEAAPFTVQIEQPQTPLVQSGAMNLRIKVQKREGWDEAVKVMLPFRSPGVNANNDITIEKGRSEGAYPINASGNAAEGEWDIAVAASAEIGGGRLWVASPLMKLKVESAFVGGEIQMTAMEQGQTADVLVKLQHRRSFEGPAKLVLHGLPTNCKTDPVEITSQSEQAIFRVQTTGEAPVGQHKSLLVQMELPFNGSTIVQSVAGNGTLRIDKARPAPVAAADKPSEPPKPADPSAPPPKPLSRLEQLRLERAAAKP